MYNLSITSPVTDTANTAQQIQVCRSRIWLSLLIFQAVYTEKKAMSLFPLFHIEKKSPPS